MTQLETMRVVREQNPSITIGFNRETQEYRITFKNGSREEKENAACYTNDSMDAVGTAHSMQVYIDECIGRNS